MEGTGALCAEPFCSRTSGHSRSYAGRGGISTVGVTYSSLSCAWGLGSGLGHNSGESTNTRASWEFQETQKGMIGATLAREGLTLGGIWWP